MPIVTIKMAKGRSTKIKRRLAKAMTDCVAKTLDVENDWVSVLIDEYDRENWASGGALHADKFGDGFGKRRKNN